MTVSSTMIRHDGRQHRDTAHNLGYFSRYRLVVPILFVAMALSGCLSPSQRFDQTAAQHGFRKTQVDGNGFRHAVYLRTRDTASSRLARHDALHLYIGGDGTPWQRGRFPAKDPTPRYPVALTLLAQDPTPSALLGRPCYHGLATAPPCQESVWTDGRYSATVVSSMTVAAIRLSQDFAIGELVLVGYSGGGTLAVLMAETLPSVRAVVTIAANLDITAWTQRHGYHPLTRSLNPHERQPLPASIQQLHLVGGNDTNVPSTIVQTYAKRQPQAQVWLFPGDDHRCCWPQRWPDALAWLAGQ